MDASEWVTYRACGRDARHAVLGADCRLCERPESTDRALTLAGKLHWLCWQQQVPWTERFRPDDVLAMGAEDFLAWVDDHPREHADYVAFLADCAAFRPSDVRWPAPAYLISAGQPAHSISLEPDGSVWCAEGVPPGRWGCDPAGVLVIEFGGAQYRFVGRADGLHLGRRTPADAGTGRPALLVLWAEQASTAAVRLTVATATYLRRRGNGYVEGDILSGPPEHPTLLGPSRPVSLEIDMREQRLRYDGRVPLFGVRVYSGVGSTGDWRIAFARPLT